MDNASKALIMAGAILISVAIVGIGIYIFSAANSMTNDAVNTMESTQVAMFNNNFYAYGKTGDDVLGSRVRALIEYAKSHSFTKSDASTSTASVNQYYVGTASGKIADTAINDRKKYKLTFHTNTAGYVTAFDAVEQ